MKFNVGDEVQFIGSSFPEIKNQVGKITCVSTDLSFPYRVKFPNDSYSLKESEINSVGKPGDVVFTIETTDKLEPPFIGTTLDVAGVKHDDDKLPYDLIPTEFLEELALVLAHGATKYERRNWEKGMRWGRVFAAGMRHAWAWWKGESKDPETGFSHLTHLAACVCFLVTYEQRGVGEDDRPV